MQELDSSPQPLSPSPAINRLQQDEQVLLLEHHEEHVHGHQVVAGHVHEVVHGKGQAK